MPTKINYYIIKRVQEFYKHRFFWAHLHQDVFNYCTEFNSGSFMRIKEIPTKLLASLSLMLLRWLHHISRFSIVGYAIYQHSKTIHMVPAVLIQFKTNAQPCPCMVITIQSLPVLSSRSTGNCHQYIGFDRNRSEPFCWNVVQPYFKREMLRQL